MSPSSNDRPVATPSTATALAIALQHQQAGRFPEAERLYRQILEQEPTQIQALNFLGALVYQQGRCAEATVYFQTVLSLQPDNPDSYNSVGIALRGAGKLTDAVEHYRQALALHPDHPQACNNLANALRDLGDLDEAQTYYERAIALNPDYPEAHNNLGVLLKTRGQLDAALEQYQRALQSHPHYAEAHHNRGIVLQRQRHFEEAIAAHQQAIALKPNYPEAFNSWGHALQSLQRSDEAIAAHQQAIALKPDYAEAHHSLGNALQQANRPDAAIAAYYQALALRPIYPEAYNNLGNALQEQKQWQAAIAAYNTALDQRPQFAEALSNLGAVYREQQQFEQAIDYFQQALAIRPDYAEVHNNLGNLYQDMGREDAAIACYQTALSHNPHLAETHSNLGNMLQGRGEFDLALEHFQQAIAQQPTFAGAYNNLGIALRNYNRIQDAFAAYDRALELNPDFVEAHWNKALNHLLLGHLPEGLAGYEWRLQWSKFLAQNPPRHYPQPAWQGEDLQGKTILIYAEQGMGDTIQFVRYAQLLRDRGGRVLLECQPPLVNVLQMVPGIAQIIAFGGEIPAFDTHASLLSLPYLCGTTWETLPTPIPYLTAEPWPLPAVGQVQVGIVWDGNRQNPYNRHRAVPLAALLEYLVHLPGIQIHSLQKEVPPEDLAILRRYPQVQDWHDRLSDFTDTARLIQALDLIISIDTAVTHLAGALGKPVWLLLPFAPDWRWMLERADSPWYPQIRLFRQVSFGDWQPVLQQIHQELQAICPADRPLASAPLPTPPLSEGVKAIIRTYQTGQTELAEQQCRQWLAEQPESASGWHLLGLMTHQTGRRPEAIDCYRRSLELDPTYQDSYNNLAVALHEADRIDEALPIYEQVLALRPDYADAHNNYANALSSKQRIAEARYHYEQAIAYQPNYADAHNNLGLLLYGLGEYEAAAAHYRQAITCRPGFAAAHNHLGNALKELGQFDAAIAAYQQAVALKPNNPKALNNWGNVYRDRGDLPIALDYYDRATDLDPNFAEAHWNKALTLLLAGDLQRGFAEYEWRRDVKLPSFQSLRSFPGQRWDGSPLQGQTIFLHAEQGMGDVIQFARYVPIVAQLGGRVILECHAPLLSLMQHLPGVQQLIPYNSAPPTYDWHAPLLSLPHILGISLDRVPVDIPYLQVPPSLDPLLPASDRCKVGIVWSGNPENPYNRTRAVPLEQLLTLVEIPSIQLYSLQKDPTTADLALLAAHPTVIDLRDRLTDFVATAQLIQQLDWVISIDSAVTHLAGALGQPVWLLLPHAPDWRWMLERTDSPWYPSLRIFRQPEPGDWSTVINQVQQAIQVPTKSQPTPPPIDVPSTVQAAIQHYQAGQLIEAEHLCQQVLRQDPDRADALHITGVILCQWQQHGKAVDYFRKVLERQPEFAEAWGNLGAALQELGQLEAAISHYQRAIALNPNYTDAHQNLAVALQACDRVEEAIQHSQQVVALRPDSADAHYNLGYMLRRLNRIDAAIAAYRRAIQLQPNLVLAHKNLGHALLLRGQFAEGWVEYEWRWRQENWSRREFAQLPWDGSDLQGKTILLYAEQGLGDTIQFIRYAALVKAKGGRVMAEVAKSLLPLLQSCPGVDDWVAQGQPLPAFDTHAPLMSLPRLLNLTAIPAPVPYLQASPDRPWQVDPSQFNIGIVWAGNPDHKNNRLRSCDLALFQPLLDLPGVVLYSLQKGDAVAQLAQYQSIQNWGDRCQNFAATAAAIASLDLVISVDTSVAHLAGALGKPVWVVLCFSPDWRWQLDRQDSPWYPTMRLFRQTQAGDWQSVFAQVKAALAAELSQPQLPPSLRLTWRVSDRDAWGLWGSDFDSAADSMDWQVIQLTEANVDQVSERTIALLAAEAPLSDRLVAAANRCHQVVAGSTWAAETLQQQGIQTVTVLPVGIDTHLFYPVYPAPKSGQWADRFVIFSGGRLSYQQGQDLVLQAFQSFHRQRPEALLLANWDIDPTAIADLNSRQSFTWPIADVQSWLDQTVGLGAAVYQASSSPEHLGQTLREADLAVFADRAVTAVNGLARAALACGIPTLMAANTGHLDLLRQNLGYPLQVQRSLPGRSGWHESDVEDLLEMWERIYRDRQEAHYRAIAAADFLSQHPWEKLLPPWLETIGA